MVSRFSIKASSFDGVFLYNASMTTRNLFLAVVALASALFMLAVGIAEVRHRPQAQIAGCPEGTAPTHHAGECRPLLPIETDTTFPWDRQQSEAKEFFRQFQKRVSADQPKEVAAMMMYPLRIITTPTRYPLTIVF